MKPFIILPRLFVMLSSFFIAQTSFAYLQYTYTSDVLEWQSTFLNGMDFGEEINVDEDRSIAFNYSFNIDENLLSDSSPTSFIINNADVYSDRSLGNPFHEPDFHALVYGRVIINPDKTIQYWNLILDLAISDLSENEQVSRLQDHDIRIISGGGRNTCNCDRLWENINLTTRRPHDTWIVAASVDNYYRSESDFNNWSVEQSAVAESNPTMLLAIGLMGILVIRKKSIKQSADTGI
jgi:hypothetical protein